jgi:2-oxo-3-(phosphooxy)propyl 3-oxoalkanoate synthase
MEPLLLQKLALWSESPPNPARVDKRYVQKEREQNVLVARVDRISPEKLDEFVAEVALDPDHAYFFEHPVDHYPALSLVDAAQQCLTAGAHLLYGIPLETEFVGDEITFKFTQYAELDQQLFMHGLVLDKQYKGERLRSVHLGCRFIQGGKEIGAATLKVRCIWWMR